VSNSLQDQLLKAGLVNAQKLKQIKTDKRKENKRTDGNPQVMAEIRQRLQAQSEEKARHDRELNRQREEEMRRREEENAIRQLIHSQRLPRAGADIAFNFQDGNRLRRLYVTGEQQRALVAGRLALVRQDAEVELVPRLLAEKLLAKNPALVVVLNHPETTAQSTGDQDDPYAAYQIPDDLIW